MVVNLSWMDILKKRVWEGTLSKDKLKILQRNPKLKLDIPKLSYPKEETEIPEIVKVMKEKELTPEEMDVADLQPAEAMLSIVGKEREDYQDLIDDINYYALSLKMKYQRARPHQISNKIQTTKTKTDNTPAFPSGHSMMAHGLERVLSKEYPEKSEELKRKANKISLSRMQMGSHYPSDLKAGKMLGYMIGDAYV